MRLFDSDGTDGIRAPRIDVRILSSPAVHPYTSKRTFTPRAQRTPPTLHSALSQHPFIPDVTRFSWLLANSEIQLGTADCTQFRVRGSVRNFHGITASVSASRLGSTRGCPRMKSLGRQSKENRRRAIIERVEMEASNLVRRVTPRPKTETEEYYR